MLRSLLTAPPWALLLLSGCKDETSAINVRVYGESFIEQGIPADDVDDRWKIEFSRFEVAVRDIVVAGVALADPESIDISVDSDGAGHELGVVSAPTGEHGKPSFTIARVDVEGSAEKDGDTKAFSWVFDSPTRYEHCETTTLVATDETATFQITVHADHLFYDSLVAPEPQLLFQPLADSDADDNGDIDRIELGNTDIGSYDPGNEEIDDLWSFLTAQSRTVGHVDGEGHCEATIAD